VNQDISSSHSLFSKCDYNNNLNATLKLDHAVQLQNSKETIMQHKMIRYKCDNITKDVQKWDIKKRDLKDDETNKHNSLINKIPQDKRTKQTKFQHTKN